MALDFEPRIVHPNPGEEIWVQSRSTGGYELGVQLNKEQFTYLELSREQLEQVYNNIEACLLEQI